MAKQQTANKTQTQQMPQQAQSSGQVAVLAPARLPFHPVYQERYGIDGMMWRALVEAVYPSAKTVEGIILAVSYCKSKNYDVMKKMVHVVPIWNTALGKEVEGVWEAVSALRATAFRTGEYAGCDETKFGPMKKMHFAGEVGRGQYAKHVEMDLEFPEWAQVTVYRLIQGQRFAFPGPTVSFLGAYGAQGKSDVPNEKWAEGPGYMLEKCAEAAALRKAFPEALGSMNAAEEMEGRKFSNLAPTIEHEPNPPPPRPTRADAVKAAEQARKGEYEMDRQFRDTMGPGGGSDQPQHDNETGEIIDQPQPVVEQQQTPANDPSQTQQEGEQSDAAQEQAQGQPTAEQANPAAEVDQGGTPAPEPQSDTYQPLADKMIVGINQCGSLSSLKGFEGKIAADLDVLRTDARAQYDQVVKAIKDRKVWFARP